METSIRQKYPDSITSLIYASKSTEDATSSTDVSYLNNRIQQLEKELEAKDKEMSLKIRSLHQKHTNMEVTMLLLISSVSVVVISKGINLCFSIPILLDKITFRKHCHIMRKFSIDKFLKPSAVREFKAVLRKNKVGI